MPSVKIVIPSMSRANTITTHRMLRECLVCIPESQVEDYARTLPRSSLLPHPDSVRGLAPKLNWMYRQMEGEPAFMVMDDDVLYMARCFTNLGEKAKVEDPDMVHEIIDNTARMAADVGAHLFGFAPNQTGIRFYTGLKPFALSGFVLGACQGFLRGHNLKNDERLVGKMDYDISALNAYRHRRCFRNDRYCLMFGDTFTSPGGQAGQRNSETEERDLQVLVRKWGLVENGGVLKVNSTRGLRKADYAGITKVTLHVPW